MPESTPEPNPAQGETEGPPPAMRDPATLDTDGRDPALLDADGRFRPRFVLSLPNDPELQLLARAFERGDYRRVNEDAPKLAAQTTDPAVKAACEELLRRTTPDPLVKGLLALSFALFVFLVAWSYLQ